MIIILDVCGLMNVSGNQRIIGGQVARPHQFPWLVAVTTGTGFCSGSLIGEEWVMTSAHCVDVEDRFVIQHCFILRTKRKVSQNLVYLGETRYRWLNPITFVTL